MIFITETGSKYEVSTGRIRRLGGYREPTLRQGSDGDWKTFESISDVVVGRVVVITWPLTVALLEGSPDYALPATITSRVVAVL